MAGEDDGSDAGRDRNSRAGDDRPRGDDAVDVRPRPSGVDVQRGQGVQVGGGAEQHNVFHNFYGSVTIASGAVAEDGGGLEVLSVRSVPEGDGGCPYPGMVAFRTSQADLFHGRDRLIADLVSRVEGLYRTGGILFVVGASGSGKSSVLRAGLVPAMRGGRSKVPEAAGWPIRVLSPGPAPVEMLATEIAAMARIPAGQVLDDLIASPQRFGLLVRQAVLAHPDPDTAPTPGPVPGEEPDRDDDRLLLVVDQFEEIFSPDVDETARQVFLHALTAAASAPGRGTSGRQARSAAVVVAAVRADFFARCLDEPLLRPHLQDRMLLVGPLTGDEIREAVEAPARTAGLRLQSGLVDLLMTDLRLVPPPAAPSQDAGNEAGPENREPGIAAATGAADPGSLPFLAHALRTMWEHRDSNELTVAGYRATGGVRRSIAVTADHLHDALTPEQQQAMRRILLRLVTLTEDSPLTRRHVTRTELLPDDDPTAAETVGTVLDRLIAARLVTATDEWIQLGHEALIDGWPRLHGWLAEDRNSLYLHRRLTDAATQWEASHRDDSLLYRGTRLHTATDWADSLAHSHDLNTLETAFLTTSRRAESRRRHRARAVATALVVLLAASLVAAGLAIRAARAATANEHIAISRQLAAQSDSLTVSDPFTAELLATAALRYAATPEANYSARNLLSRSRQTIGACQVNGVSNLE